MWLSLVYESWKEMPVLRKLVFFFLQKKNNKNPKINNLKEKKETDTIQFESPYYIKVY